MKFIPKSVAVIVEALTDNRNRTAPEVRHLLDKYGKGLGATGCVSWSFDQKGVIVIEREDLDEDTVMMDALDSGADDMQADEECFEITTTPDSFGEVLAKLEEKGYAFLSAGVRPLYRSRHFRRSSVPLMSWQMPFLRQNVSVCEQS